MRWPLVGRADGADGCGNVNVNGARPSVPDGYGMRNLDACRKPRWMLCSGMYDFSGRGRIRKRGSWLSMSRLTMLVRV